MKQRSKWVGLGVAAASLAAIATVQAGTATFEFETNPTNEGIVFYGNAKWYTTGGNPGGFLSVTDAADGQRSVLVFPDIDQGLVVKAFTFECDIRAGGGEDPPADGFSISYAREGDPAINNGAFAASPTGEANLPEEGTQTGLAIGLDEWLSGGSDVRGFSVRVDNVIFQEISLPNISTTLEDITSLQTGPLNPARDPNDITTSWALLGWAPFKLELNEQGQISLWWKNHQFLTNYQTEFFPSPGRLVFAARTGDNNGNHHVDNIRLTTIGATNFLISSMTGRADGFKVTINDAQGSVLNPASIKLKLNDTDLPSNSYTVSKAGNVSTVTYSHLPNFLPAGSTNKVDIEAQDNNGVVASVSREFVVRPYIVLDPSWIAPAGTYDSGERGFVGSINQIAVGRSPGDGTSTWNAFRQLANGFLDPATGNPYSNLVDPVGGTDANGNFEMPDGLNFFEPWININQDVFASPPAEAGSFQAPEFPDYPIPGIPGLPVPPATTGGTDNIVMEAYTYLQLGAANGKLYTFAVNSDDGFHVAFGPQSRSAVFTAPGGASTSTYSSQYNGGKGASDVTFDVAVPQGASGVYRARLVWWEGGGGANCEFLQILDDGTKVLVGDEASVPNYKPAGAGQGHIADIVSVAPWPGQTGIRPDSQIQIILADGAGQTVDGNSVTVKVNGVEFAKTVSKTGDKTRVTASPTVLLEGGVANNVEVTWTAGGTARTNTWAFTTLPYTALPEWLARPLGSGTNPGFTARVHQLGTTQEAVDAGVPALGNRWHIRDQQLEGLFGPSVATVAANADQALTTVNFNADEPLANIGFFNDDVKVPGIPGTKASRNTDDIAMEVVTYIEFPTAGYYQMGVNSDDGFRVIAREKWSRLPLKIESPANLFPNGWVGAVARSPQDSVVQAALPVPAIQAQIVATVPADASTAIQNASELAGKIALIDRGVVSFDIKVDAAEAAGAIGVIVVDNAPDRVPIEMGSVSANIPAVMISQADGNTIKTAMGNGPVTASIGGDSIPTLGYYNDGRGQGTATTFGFQITKPGLYPFRLLWFEGNGGANCEWLMISPTGVQALINDPANSAVGLKAFRNAPAVVEPQEATFNPPAIANGQVTISWEGSGTLQESTDLINWTNSASQANPQNVTPEGSIKAYRILVSP